MFTVNPLGLTIVDSTINLHVRTMRDGLPFANHGLRFTVYGSAGSMYWMMSCKDAYPWYSFTSSL